MAATVRPELTARAAPRLRVTRSGETRVVREDLPQMLAHDLKTPLTAIAMNLDYVLGELSAYCPSSTRAALEDCRAANGRAIGLVTDMVDAVRLASGERRAVFADVDVTAVIFDTVDRLTGEAAIRGVQLTRTGEAARCRADEDLLRRALERVVERALRHARTGDGVDVSVGEGLITVRVSTTGAGDGAGSEAAMRALSIYFADWAMRVQGGAVWSETDPTGALVFFVSLPA